MQNELIAALRGQAITLTTIYGLTQKPGPFGKGRAIKAIKTVARREAIVCFELYNKAHSAAVLKTADIVAAAHRELAPLGETEGLRRLMDDWHNTWMQEARTHRPETEWPAAEAVLMTGFWMVILSHLDEWSKSKTQQLQLARTLAEDQFKATMLAAGVTAANEP